MIRPHSFIGASYIRSALSVPFPRQYLFATSSRRSQPWRKPNLEIRTRLSRTICPASCSLHRTRSVSGTNTYETFCMALKKTTSHKILYESNLTRNNFHVLCACVLRAMMGIRIRDLHTKTKCVIVMPVLCNASGNDLEQIKRAGMQSVIVDN